MPIDQLPDFDDLVASKFHIGGNPQLVLDTHESWMELADCFRRTAWSLQELDLSDLKGESGAQFRKLVTEDLPESLIQMAKSHEYIGDRIFVYFMEFGQAFIDMENLAELEAFDNYEALVEAIDDYNTAEAKMLTIQKELEDNPSKSSDGLSAAKVNFVEAERHYQAMLARWDKDLEKARAIQDRLGKDVDICVELLLEGPSD